MSIFKTDLDDKEPRKTAHVNIQIYDNYTMNVETWSQDRLLMSKNELLMMETRSQGRLLKSITMKKLIGNSQ